MPPTLKVQIRDRWYTVEVGDLHASPVRTLVDGDPIDVEVEPLAERGVSEMGAETQTVDQAPPQGPPEVTGRQVSASEAHPQAPSAGRAFTSPMPGIIISVAVQVGEHVVTGDEVCILEAMKMQQTLRADWSGIVSAVHVQPGQQVLDGDPIVHLE